MDTQANNIDMTISPIICYMKYGSERANKIYEAYDNDELVSITNSVHKPKGYKIKDIFVFTYHHPLFKNKKNENIQYTDLMACRDYDDGAIKSERKIGGFDYYHHKNPLGDCIIIHK